MRSPGLRLLLALLSSPGLARAQGGAVEAGSGEAGSGEAGGDEAAVSTLGGQQDCVALPAGDCVSRAPRLLPAGAVEGRLASGVRVIVVPAPTSGRVAIELRLALGDRVAAAPVQDAAITWILARHEGGAASPARRQRRVLLGADERIQALQGGVAIRVEGPATALAELLSLEVGRLTDFAPPSASVERATAGAAGERQRALASPDRLVVELLRPAPGIGGATTAEQVQRRFRQAWGGANLVVVVAGDVEAAPTLELASSVLSALPALEPAPVLEPPPPPPAPGPDLAASVSHATSPIVAAPRVAVAWSGPPTTPGTVEHAAREVLRELMVAPGSPLLLRLRSDAVAARLWSPRVHDGLVVAAELRPGAHPGAAIAAIEAAAAELSTLDDGALGPRVDAARQHLARRAMLTLQQPGDWAVLVADAVAAGADPLATDRAVDALREVDAAAVRQAALSLALATPGRDASLLPEPAPASAPASGAP